VFVRSGRWTVCDSVPTLVLPPKCGTTSIISFLNSCASGLISPKQLTLCLKAPCSDTVETHNGDIDHLHLVPSDGESVYALIRHPVTRFISFIRYRLSFDHPWRDMNRSVGLSLDDWRHTNVSALIDRMSDQSMRALFPFFTITRYVGPEAIMLCSFEDFAMHVQQHYNFTHCPSVVPKKIPGITSASYPLDSAREDQRVRIARVFHDDMRLWEKACKGRSIW
jgi:hypothetical protein